jgi:hypothetical protein
MHSFLVLASIFLALFPLQFTFRHEFHILESFKVLFTITGFFLSQEIPADASYFNLALLSSFKKVLSTYLVSSLNS